MRIRSLFDATLGRLRLPLRALGVGVQPGEVVLDTRFPRVRTNETTPRTARLITDLDLGTPGNPPVLGDDGLLPANVIPPTDTGGGGGASDSLLGEIRMWCGFPFRVPSGWLVCDGSELLISANPDLFGVIGHLYGRPSAPTKFKLPNFVGRAPMGCAGPNAAAAGTVQKINVRSPGSGYANGTYPVVLVASGSTIISSPITANILVTGGQVVKVDIVTGGQVSGVTASANPTTDPSNVSLTIPAFGAPGIGFTYDILLAPTSSAVQGWGIRVTNDGDGYTSDPEVVIAGGGVVGATARAVRDGDRIREIIVTNPGNGDPTGATVTLNGGGWTVQATATIVFNTSPTVPGDTGGEQQHQQMVSQLARHTHVDLRGNSFRERDGGQGIHSGALPNPGDATAVGDDVPMNVRPPYIGILFLIRAS